MYRAFKWRDRQNTSEHDRNRNGGGAAGRWRAGCNPSAQLISTPAQRVDPVAVAVFLAGALTAAAIVVLWAPYPAKSDVIGYPIFADYNPNNYAHAYYLAVGLFPIAALLIFLGLTRIGPRVGLAVPPSRGRLRPLVSPAEAERSLGSGADLAGQPSFRRGSSRRHGRSRPWIGDRRRIEPSVAERRARDDWLFVAGRLGVGCTRPVHVLAVDLGSQAGHSQFPGPIATVVGLSLVSAHTDVRVLSNNTVHHYSWFPAWLGLPLAAALFAWIVVSLRRAGPAAAAAIERRTVLLIAAPVALFVLVAAPTGRLGADRLVRSRAVSYRDEAGVTRLVALARCRGGAWAAPGRSSDRRRLGCVRQQLLGRRRGRLRDLRSAHHRGNVLAARRPRGTQLAGAPDRDLDLRRDLARAADARFLLWPAVLLLLAAVLKRFTPVRGAALGALTVVQAIVTPEMAAAVPIVAVVVAAYEWYWRPVRAPSARAFRRTIWLVIGAVASACAFAVYMASRGALGDVISVTRDSLAGQVQPGDSAQPGRGLAGEV